MLGYYAGRFPTVEINNTFYRMPAAEMLRKWGEETPDGFRFSLKSPRRITHEKKLSDTRDSLLRLYEAAAALGPKLGPVLFQLPPTMRKNLPLLEAFLAELPPSGATKAAFEFRHESWLSPDVYAALRARGAALCIAEAEDFATPLEATASWGYLRLRRQDYGEADLVNWAGRIKAQGWDTAFVFFKHEDEGRGPQLAARLIQQLGEQPAAPRGDDGAPEG
jgi:uncharacterized protein YecE (DUF72 family)